MKKLATVFVAVTLFVAASSARAVTYTGSEATTASKKEASVTLKASATFMVVSNLELVVTLSNTGSYDPRSPGEILTGVFFDFVGDPHLTPYSATVPMPGDSVIGHPVGSNFVGNVSGEWGYTNGLAYTTSEGTDNEGISSTKLKWFKKKDLFDLSPGGKIRGASPLSGVNFGTTTVESLATNAVGAIKNVGLIQNTVVFVFDLPNNLNNLTTDEILADVSNVTFQYGTSIKSGLDITGEMVAQVPEPNTISLVAAGLLGAVALAGARARRR
jgi:hypothetical protein